MVAAYAVYYVWRPTTFTNYGELIAPTPIADATLRQPNGNELKLDAFKGKWVFLMVDSGSCDEFCQRKLYDMRQVRLTQGKDMDRIERAWLIDDNLQPSSAVASEYAGTHMLSAQGSPLLSQLPADRSVRDHIYIMDPLGNLMMRYPRDADPNKIKQDVVKLLKVSRIG
jgi:cytochrome oxidase Cu insertion factor (SCO1/SenC/PrrC family)